MQCASTGGGGEDGGCDGGSGEGGGGGGGLAGPAGATGLGCASAGGADGGCGVWVGGDGDGEGGGQLRESMRAPEAEKRGHVELTDCGLAGSGLLLYSKARQFPPVVGDWIIRYLTLATVPSTYAVATAFDTSTPDPAASLTRGQYDEYS